LALRIRRNGGKVSVVGSDSQRAVEHVDQRVWNVLVVDDDPDVGALIRLTLRFDDQLRVVGMATSAEDAMAMARQIRPNLVILDHLLGGPVTGLQVAHQLREDFPEIRVILFSAAETVIDLRDQQVDAVLSKMDIDDLADIAHQVLDPPL
jgi:DNA-binding NarL/FixJ family response regulator